MKFCCFIWEECFFYYLYFICYYRVSWLYLVVREFVKVFLVEYIVIRNEKIWDFFRKEEAGTNI